MKWEIPTFFVKTGEDEEKVISVLLQYSIAVSYFSIFVQCFVIVVAFAVLCYCSVLLQRSAIAMRSCSAFAVLCNCRVFAVHWCFFRSNVLWQCSIAMLHYGSPVE